MFRVLLSRLFLTSIESTTPTMVRVTKRLLVLHRNTYWYDVHIILSVIPSLLCPLLLRTNYVPTPMY